MPEESSEHGQMTIIEIQAIDPSPFQRRQHFEENKLKGLAASIQRDGLIEPIFLALLLPFLLELGHLIS